MDAIRAPIAQMERGERAACRTRRGIERRACGPRSAAFVVSSLATLALLVAVWFVLPARRRSARGAAGRRATAIASRRSCLDLTDRLVATSRATSLTATLVERVHGPPRGDQRRGWRGRHPPRRSRPGAAVLGSGARRPGALRVEYRLRRHDGEYRDMGSNAAPVYEDENGRRARVGRHLHRRHRAQPRRRRAPRERGAQRRDPRDRARLHHRHRRRAAASWSGTPPPNGRSATRAPR